MKTKDLIAKRMRRERAHLRKERNKQTEPTQSQKSKKEGEYTIPEGFAEVVLKEVKKLPGLVWVFLNTR